MEYEVDINIAGRADGDITVCGDGEVDIVAESSLYGGNITVILELEELEEIVKQAKAHKAAYDAFAANDYEDIVMPKIGDTVKPNWGRNAGKWGKVLLTNPKTLSVLVDFGGKIPGEDCCLHPDQYWSSIIRMKIVKK